MDALRNLIEQIDRDKLEWASRQSFEDKLLDGPRLFDRSCRIMKDGIRWQFPNADPAEVDRILDERLALISRLDREA